MAKTRQSNFYWFFIYPIVFITFVFISLVIILSAKGYSFSFQEGITLKKTGMIIVSSKPTGASITLDGKKLDRKTNSFFLAKLDELSPGNHNLSVTKSGYYPWSKSLEVLPETVTWADYILLFEKNPDILDIVFREKILDYLPSPNNKYTIFYLDYKGQNKVVLMNNESQEFTTLLSSKELTAEKITQLEFQSWTLDEEEIIFKAEIGKEKDKVFFIYNIEDEVLRDFSSLFSIKFDQILDDGESQYQLYGLKNNNISRLNLLNNTVSKVLQKNVLATKTTPTGLYFIKQDGKKIILARISNEDYIEIIDTLPHSNKYIIKPNPQEEKMVAVGTDHGVLLVKEENGKFSTLTLSKTPSDFEWNKNGRKIFYKAKDGYHVYDFHYKKEYKINNGKLESPGWYFNKHIIGKKDSDVVVLDFDGKNVVKLGQTQENKDIFVSPENKTIYYFSTPQNNKGSLLKAYNTNF